MSTRVSVGLQGDFPWDEKEFRYLAVMAAGVGSALLYFYFRDNGREISWKDLVHRYVGRGLVSAEICTIVCPVDLLLSFLVKKKVNLKMHF